MDCTGLKLAKEIMIKNSAVSNLIRENDLHQIPSVIQMGARESMQLIEKDVVDLIQR
jgi:twitching motility protein PilT